MNIIVITGASSGLGREFAIQLDQCNLLIDEIWLIARRKERLEEVALLLSHPCRILPYDLTTNEGILGYENELKQTNPMIKMLINCSGFGFVGKFGQIALKEQASMIDLNCKALTQITYLSIPYMKSRSRIIQLASSASFMPQPGFAVYAASKSYVLSFARALSEELRKDNIFVTAVCPGPVRTEFFEHAEKYGKSFTFKKYTMVDTKQVVHKAIKNSLQGKTISVYGLPMNLFYFFSKIIPHKWLLTGLRMFH